MVGPCRALCCEVPEEWQEDPVETDQLLEEVREGACSSCWVVPEKVQDTRVNWKFRETASDFLKY